MDMFFERWFVEAVLTIVGAVLAAGLACWVIDSVDRNR
jgi:hypothetical protein